MPAFKGQRLEVQKHFAALQRRGVSIRAYLMGLVALVLTPALLLGVWLAAQSADAQRALLHEQAGREAREVITAIESEIQNARNILITLAGSPDLKARSLAPLRQQASEVAERLGVQVILREPGVRPPLINTRPNATTDDNRPIPPERMEAEALAIATGQPVVSNVFAGALSGRLVAVVMVPVTVNDGTTMTLSISIPAQRFSDILQNMQIPEAWVATVYDRATTIVARSHKNQEFAGTKIRAESPELLVSQSGFNTSISRDGIAYVWFRRQSLETGWFVSIGMPQSALNAASRDVFFDHGIAGGILLIGALALAYYLGGRISQSVGALGIDRKPTREEFQVLFEHAPSGVLVADSDGKIALLNEQMERMFGYPRDRLVGKPVASLIPERLIDNYMRSSTAELRAKPTGIWQDLSGQRANGSEFPIEIGLNPISTAAGPMIIATIVDITARQQAAERLARTTAERDDLRRRLMEAQEDERLRLAHELHDQTGQSLTAVMLQLKGLESLVSDHGRDRLRVLRKQLEEMGKTLHRVAWELRPASIDELGISSALTNYVADWGAQTEVEADFHCRDTKLDGLPAEVRTTLYRVVQEALTNISKHAPGTTSVSVVIDRSEGVLRLTIEDDGLGFDPTSPNERDRRGRLGIAGMRERLALIGGELEVESTLGVGTTIFARVPLESERLIA